MTKAEQTRLTAWRLRVLQQAADDGNVARVCRRFGISRKSFYKCKRRRADHGDAGLCDRARTPRYSPTATAPDVVSKILNLRQHYHFGAGRIAAYLHRFHRIKIAVSSVHRILTRHGMPRLPANQKHQPHGKRWQRYEKPQPGHRLQLDVKLLERTPGTRRRLYQFTAIDDCTRIRVLKIYDACNQRTATQFIDEVVRRLPFRVHVVQTGNGAEFQSEFHWHFERLDIRHATFARARRASMARWSVHTMSMTRSSTSSSTRTASAMTFTCSARSCASGRTITITIAHTERSMAKPRTSDC
jgi:transposase-like protein